MGPQRGVFVKDAVLPAAVDGVLTEILDKIHPGGIGKKAAASQPGVDLKEHIAPAAAVVFHVEVGKADVAQLFQKSAHLLIERVIAAREDSGVVADGAGIVKLQHRLAQAHGAHLTVVVGIAVEHTHRIVPAGDELLQDQLTRVARAVHAPDHGEIVVAVGEEVDLLLALKFAVQIVACVAVFGLDDDGKVKGQCVDGGSALRRGADGGLRIVQAILVTKGIETVLGVEGFQQLHGVEAVADQTIEMIIVPAQKPRVVVRAGDDHKAARIVRRALLQNLQQCVGKNLVAVEAGNFDHVEELAVACGIEPLGAQQQRLHGRIAQVVVKQPCRAVGIFVAAEDDREKIIFLHLFASFCHIPSGTLAPTGRRTER